MKAHLISNASVLLMFVVFPELASVFDEAKVLPLLQRTSWRLLESGCDRPENRYGGYGSRSFASQRFMSALGVGWSPSFPLKIYVSCSLGGGGTYLVAPSTG